MRLTAARSPKGRMLRLERMAAFIVISFRRKLGLVSFCDPGDKSAINAVGPEIATQEDSLGRDAEICGGV